jgi:uncharacterized protein YidB (DUF937 family)
MQEMLGRLFGGGGKEAKLMQGLVGMVQGGGGLQGLLGKFQAAGMGDQVQSWIGSSPSQPIDGQQVRQALGNEEVDKLANDAGLPPNEAANDLAKMIPETVSQLTPNGQIPDAAGMQEQLKSLSGKIPGL